MQINELIKSEKHRQHVLRFVNDDLFKDIVLAFVMHSPNGTDTNADSISVAHGKSLGTKYVFEQLEQVAKTPPTTTTTTRREGARRDPDLA